jgi:tetratricopeptide (TPR) repeat protein
MSLTAWLDLIRKRFSPDDGQILVRSLQQDPLVWQFIQDGETSLPYFENAPNNLAAYTPGKMAAWLIEQTTGLSLTDIGHSNFVLPAELKSRAAQALETTFNTGLPPADLMNAGLLALILQERRFRKESWKGLSEEIFIHRNQQSILKNYRVWQTSFACLFDFCPDFEELSADFTTSSSETIRKTYIPIFLHTLIANPMEPDQLMENLLGVTKHLSIDLQLESLRWLRDLRQGSLQVGLAKQLLQTKDNRDFFARVFSELEAFNAVSSDIDPLEKPLPYALPEDVNRLAAFHFFSGNAHKAIENYQKASDLLEFLKAQTLFQALAGEIGHTAPSRWLEIIKSVPHSKQARLFYARSLIKEQQFDEARQQLEELPQTTQQQLLLNQTLGEEQVSLSALLKEKNTANKSTEGKFRPQASYFIHETQLATQSEILKAISREKNLQEYLPWLEKYLQGNFSDLKTVKLAQELYENNHQIEKAIELTAYLERSEPTVISHKRKLARLYAQAERWQDAFAFLQTLVKSESKPEIEELEMFAEAAIRTGEAEMGMSICQNILKRSADNPKALVLLGEVYLHKGDVVKAIQHMESVVELIPHEPEAWLTLSWLWAENDQTDRSLETLKKGIKINPDQPKLLRALGKAQVERQDLPEALSAYKQAYDLEPNHIEGKLDLAGVYCQVGQPEKAYPLVEMFTKNYEQHPQAARLLGHVLLALDQVVTAEPILLFAAEHFPDDLSTVLSAVQLVLDRVEADPEIEPDSILQKVGAILNQASEVYPDHADIKRHMADIDRLNGQHQKAFDVYSRLAKVTDHQKSTVDWRLKYGLGQAAMGLGNHEVGLAALQDALGIQPSNLIIRHALADAFQATDLIEKANAMAKSALRMAPQDLNNILWYAKYKTSTNDPDEAVRALKEAINLTPQRDELKLWLAKSLISAGSIEEAHATIAEFIASSPPNPELLHQAGYVGVHLNDLDLAAQALEKALQIRTEFNPTMLMDLAIIYSLKEYHNKALEILEIEPNLIAEYPQIAVLKADLLCNIGQYEFAHTTLQAINECVEQVLTKDAEKSSQINGSPLLYAHDLTLDGYYLRLGQVSRALGKFDEAQQHLSTVLNHNPQDSRLRNAFIETALVGLNYQPALEHAKHADPLNQKENTVSHDWLDLNCSQAEVLMYQDDYEQAATLVNQLSHAGGAYPRYLAIQSRFASNLGEIEIAREHLNNAIKSFNETIGSLQSQAPSVIFRQIINLHSIAEASLSLGNHLEAIQTWEKIYSQLSTQPLINWRYLYALVTGAEAQQIANTLAITTNCPGEICLSEDHHRMAERLLNDLQSLLPQDQIICLKARIESAFTGTWPTHLNVDACLQGPEEAAAVLIGSEDENLVKDILESYPDDLQVLQAYGIYALSHQKIDAIPFVENALTLDTANPINHALLAHLNVEQPEQATKSIETALSFWPNEPEWHVLAADLNAKLGNTEMAQRHIQFALDNQPENAKFWQKSALLKVQTNDYAQAKSDLERSTAFRPDDPKTWAAMADVNRRMGDVSDALTNIRKASQLDPGDKNLVEMEMQLLSDQKNFVGLEEKAKIVITENSADENAQIFYAQALAKQGKFEQALEAHRQTLTKDPLNTHIALEYHKIKKDQLGVEKVLPDLISLAQNHPQDPEVLTTLTDWLIQANRIDEAEKVAQTTLRIVPDQAEVHLMLGRLQRVKGKLDQAITHLTQAITLDISLIEAYIELGKTYQERRDLDKAIEIFEKGSQANKSDPRPYYYAGLALKDIKDYPGAELMLKQAKKYSPDDTNIIRQLGVVTALNLVNNLREAK